MSIGKSLRMIRTAKKLSQRQLAEMAGFSLDTISRWERGDRYPNIKDIEKLAQVLDTSIAFLVGETNNPAPIREQPKGENIFAKKFEDIGPDDWYSDNLGNDGEFDFAADDDADDAEPIHFSIPSDLLLSDAHAYEKLLKQANAILKKERRKHGGIELRIEKLVSEVNRRVKRLEEVKEERGKAEEQNREEEQS